MCLQNTSRSALNLYCTYKLIYLRHLFTPTSDSRMKQNLWLARTDLWNQLLYCMSRKYSCPIYIVSYYTKLVTTSCTHSRNYVHERKSKKDRGAKMLACSISLTTHFPINHTSRHPIRYKFILIAGIKNDNTKKQIIVLQFMLRKWWKKVINIIIYINCIW